MSRNIILASTSPRRRELLKRACIAFTSEAPRVKEDMRQRVSPQEMVKNIAWDKAFAVAKRHIDAVIISADTVVALGKKRWSKPESVAEARMMLRALSGKTHDVWTGYCIIDTMSGTHVLDTVKTRVTLRTLTRGEIERYIETGEPLDGAGGYKMQEGGGFVIDRISGDYTNILGLPLGSVLRGLRKLGVQMLS